MLLSCVVACVELRADGDDDASMLAKVKAFDENLPPTNHFKRTTYPRPFATLPDEELVDLLLHPRDRAFGAVWKSLESTSI